MADLFKITNTALPANTRAVLEGVDLQSVDNFALKLNKCANFLDKKNLESNDDITTLFDDKKEVKSFFYISKYKKKENKIEKEFKLSLNPTFNTDCLEKCHKSTAQAAALCGVVKDTLILKTDWRIALGMGNASVFENGITLHHIYGFPYLPASALKGICNHYAQDNGYNTKDKKDYDTIFGNTDQQGKIIFFDAYPTGNITLSPDIINNHYPDYYGDGAKPPADWQSPRPIFFLTVKDTEFKFILGVKDKADNHLLEKAYSWLKNALKEKGIGAKTAVGYGYMQ